MSVWTIDSDWWHCGVSFLFACCVLFCWINYPNYLSISHLTIHKQNLTPIHEYNSLSNTWKLEIRVCNLHFWHSSDRKLNNTILNFRVHSLREKTRQYLAKYSKAYFVNINIYVKQRVKVSQKNMILFEEMTKQ